MNTLRAYLQTRRLPACTLLLMAALFYWIISLYQLPAEAVLYASAVAGSVGFCACAIDFVRFYRRHKLLTRLQASICVSLSELPHPATQIEQDYQVLLELLLAETHRLSAQAQRSMDAMTQYYTLWAHQVKTPIAAMHLLLQSGSYSEQDLHAELFKIEEYVGLALCYLRLESPSTDYVLRQYELDDILRQAVHKYARMFIQKGIQLQYSRVNQRVYTDEKWLLFVIEQILSNAIKYTKRGQISVFMQEQTLVIEDTGCGIEESDLPRVFSRGFTGARGREDKRATGLGLHLCKQILDRISHEIRIESTLGVGTKLFLTFPKP